MEAKATEAKGAGQLLTATQTLEATATTTTTATPTRKATTSKEAKATPTGDHRLHSLGKAKARVSVTFAETRDTTQRTVGTRLQWTSTISTTTATNNNNEATSTNNNSNSRVTATTLMCLTLASTQEPATQEVSLLGLTLRMQGHNPHTHGPLVFCCMT